MNMYPFEHLIPGEPSVEARFREEYAGKARAAKKPQPKPLTVSSVSANDIKAKLIASVAGYTPGI